MEWLSNLVTVLVEQGLGLSVKENLGGSIHFFIYDVVKIFILLSVLIFAISYVQSFFPPERTRKILGQFSGLSANILAALLGTVTPFCSCSSIPLFIGFMAAGIPLGITFTFLISSPLINESSLYLFPAMFGMKVTILYNIFGIVIAMLGGMLMQRLKLEKYIMPEFLNIRSKPRAKTADNGTGPKFGNLIGYFWASGLSLTKKIFPYVVLGVGLGAIIHGFVPSSLVENILSAKSWWTVPLAVIFGVPFYANSVSVLPVMEALAGKGAPLGTVLAFMTAIVALSLPEAIILKKVMRWPLLAIFFGITTIGIILMGYLFNIIL